MATETLSLLYPNTHKVEWKLPFPATCGCILPNGQLLVATKQRLMVVDIDTGTEVQQVEWTNPEPIRGLATSPCGTWFAVVSQTTGYLYNRSKFTILAEKKRASCDSTAVAVGRNWWAWLSGPQKVIAHPINEQSFQSIRISVNCLPNGSVQGLAFHPKRDLLAVAGIGGSLMGAFMNSSGTVGYGNNVGEYPGIHLYDLKNNATQQVASKTKKEESQTTDSEFSFIDPNYNQSTDNEFSFIDPNHNKSINTRFSPIRPEQQQPNSIRPYLSGLPSMLVGIRSADETRVICWSGSQIFGFDWSNDFKPAMPETGRPAYRTTQLSNVTIDHGYMPSSIVQVLQNPQNNYLVVQLANQSVVEVTPNGVQSWLEIAEDGSGTW